MAATLLKVTAKVGLAFGAVFVTVDQGVWSCESKQGYKALTKVRSTVLPVANEYVEKIPSPSAISSGVANGWNSGVKVIFSGLSHAPETSRDLTKKALTTTRNFVQHKS